MSRCILVLGVARSGTSAVAGALHHLGVHMLDIEKASTQQVSPNPRGTFEDENFLTLGLQLQKNGFSASETIKKSYLELIARRRQQYALWGFKDPRSMFALEHFLEYLGDSRAVLVRRNAEATRRSLRQWGPAVQAPPFWLQATAYQRAILMFPGLRLTVDYEALVADPEGEIDRLGMFVFSNLPWQQTGVGLQPTTAQIAAAVEFIDPALKHY